MPPAIRAASFGCAGERQLTAIGPASGRRDTADLASAGAAAPNSAAPSTPAPVTPAQSTAAPARLTRPRRAAPPPPKRSAPSHVPPSIWSAVKAADTRGYRRDVPVPALVPQQTH